MKCLLHGEKCEFSPVEFSVKMFLINELDIESVCGGGVWRGLGVASRWRQDESRGLCSAAGEANAAPPLVLAGEAQEGPKKPQWGWGHRGHDVPSRGKRAFSDPDGWRRGEPPTPSSTRTPHVCSRCRNPEAS